MQTFHIFPCHSADDRPTWPLYLSTAELADHSHPAYTTGFNMPHCAVPRPLVLPHLKVLCRHLCLPCRRIDCPDHPRAAGVLLSSDGAKARIITHSTAAAQVLRAKASGRSVFDAVRRSLVIEADGYDEPGQERGAREDAPALPARVEDYNLAPRAVDESALRTEESDDSEAVNGAWQAALRSPDHSDEAANGAAPVARKMTWTFGCCELFTLLSLMTDFDDYPSLEDALFSRQHVVRRLAGCEKREAAKVLAQAKKLEQQHLLLSGLRRTVMPRWARGRQWRRTHLDVDCARDEQGRRAAGSIVQAGDTLAAHVAVETQGAPSAPRRIRWMRVAATLQGRFVLRWQEDCPDNVLDAALLEEVCPTGNTQRCLNRQADFVRLLRDIHLGKTKEPSSVAKLAGRFEARMPQE